MKKEPKKIWSSATILPRKRLLTTEEAGEYLSIAPATLTNWRSERRGPAFVTLAPRVIRYEQTELENWNQKNSTRFQQEAG